MKLPWKNPELKQKIENLQASIEEKNQQIEKLENMLEAEKNRRKKHTRDKQEAQEKVNRLEDQLKGLKEKEEVNEEKDVSEVESQDLGLDSFLSSLEKLGSIRADNSELLTVYSPGKLSNHSKIQDIKSTVPEEKLEELLNLEKLLIFYDPNLGLSVFKSTPFYDEKSNVGKSFEVEKLLSFVAEEKIWVLVSRGETRIYSEKNGEVEKIEEIKSRVNSKHGKGGFSQGRFERKRDEQVHQHLEQVEKQIKGLEKIYLLGEKTLCKELPGQRLGGFDPNLSPLENFYRPRKIKISSN